MKKIVLIFILGLMCWQNAKAQKHDTLAYYMRLNGTLATDKNDADYLLIIYPADTISDKVLFPVIVISYWNGLKTIASSLTNDYKALKFEGTAVDFYKNGRRESISYYKNGKLDGDYAEYFPNGKIYQLGKNRNGELKLIECRDSTGKVLAESGNGRWVVLDEGRKNIVLQGIVKDSLKEGEWEGMDSNRVACVNIYKHGTFVSGTFYFKSGKKFQYHTDGAEPQYADGGYAGFNQFVSRAVKFPDIDRQQGRQGHVIVTFVVEKDGSLSDVKALRSPSITMAEAAIEAVRQSPKWVPSIQNGSPVRLQFTISVAFSLADKY